MIMKKIFNLLLLALLLSGAAYAQNDGDAYMSKSLSKESISQVFSRTSGGNIAVTGVADGEARIEVFISASNNKTSYSKDEIKQRLDEDYNLTVEVVANKLTATAEPKKSNMNWKRALSISFKIYVPSNVSTDLNTSGGGIDLTNLSGTHNFSTSGGGLHLSKISGKTRGKTSGGGITVKDSKDDITLSTSGGGIHATDCSGILRLNTSGGSIDLNDLNGEIEAETSGGTVRGANIRGDLTTHTSGGSIILRNLFCGVDASTSGGSIELEITEVGKYVTANNSGGNISVKMPGDKGLSLRLRGDKINTVSLNNFSGDQDENRITGKVNGGGIPVTLSTSGRLTFSLK